MWCNFAPKSVTGPPDLRHAPGKWSPFVNSTEICREIGGKGFTFDDLWGPKVTGPMLTTFAKLEKMYGGPA